VKKSAEASSGIRQTISVAADVASIRGIQFNTFQRLFEFYIQNLDIAVFTDQKWCQGQHEWKMTRFWVRELN
jgi:hypothetical protein